MNEKETILQIIESRGLDVDLFSKTDNIRHDLTPELLFIIDEMLCDETNRCKSSSDRLEFTMKNLIPYYTTYKIKVK